MKVLVLSTDVSGGGAEYVARVMLKTLRNTSAILFDNKEKLICSENVKVLKKWNSSKYLSKLLLNLYRTAFVQMSLLSKKPQVVVVQGRIERWQAQTIGTADYRAAQCAVIRIGTKTRIFLVHHLYSRSV